MIRSKLVPQLTRREYDECRSLTLSGLSMMRDQLQWDRDKQTDSRAIIVIENNQIIAWALVHSNSASSNDKSRRIAYFYVHKDHRREGHGRRIYRHARRVCGEFEVCPSNDINRAFFRSVKAHAAPGWRWQY
jgi:predicted acetyltransferase